MSQTLVNILGRLSWQSVYLDLRHTGSGNTNEPLLAIFQSLLKSAWQRSYPRERAAFVFHPRDHHSCQHLGVGSSHRLEVIFPRQTNVRAGHFIEALEEHLDNPRHNFSLEKAGGPENRSLEHLFNESPDLRHPDFSEIQLNFLTPYASIPRDRKRRWEISGADFLGNLARRIDRLYQLSEVATLTAKLVPATTLNSCTWQYKPAGRHRGKSAGGRIDLNGTVGPIFLRGKLEPVIPLLLVGSELHCGRRVTYGQGYYRLTRDCRLFDRQLQERHRYEILVQEVNGRSDLADDLGNALLDRKTFVADLHREISSGEYQPESFTGYWLAKKKLGKRLVAAPRPRDHLVQKFLQLLLTPVLDRQLEDACIGFRQGRSRNNAREFIRDACRDGYTYVVEADIASFFDEIDWETMLDKLHHYLPTGDLITLKLIERIMTADIEVKGKRLRRTKGLVQGSPLSPLLANLYLDSFDEAVLSHGYRLIRYGDDFMVMVRSRQEAEQALTVIEDIAAKLKLSLRREKTTIAPLDAGISFLGLNFPEEIDESFVDQQPLRKPLFILPHYAFIGIDYNTVVVRKGRDLLARRPLKRISEIIIFGTNTVSTRLFQRATSDRIPVSFCSASGYYLNTLKPDSRAHYLRLANHIDRHAKLTTMQKNDIARRIVLAKIHNYHRWLRRRHGQAARSQITRLQLLMKKLETAATLESIQGYEGAGARVVFSFCLSLVNRQPGFDKVTTRQKHRKPDRYNSLLDFAYYLLFTRLNVLLRSTGLNPYLGFLHSPKDDFESLICDLQEPFRYRMDRLVITLINLKIITKDDFSWDRSQGYRLQGDAIGTFLERFEREMDTERSGERGTLRQLLIAQVQNVRHWVERDEKLAFYQNG